MNAKKRKRKPLKHRDPEVNRHHLSSGDYIFIKKDNAMSNKLEQRALDQINQIDEGIFSGFLEKLISGRLKKQLKILEKDPQLNAAFERFNKSAEDLERDVAVYAKLVQDMDGKDLKDNDMYSDKKILNTYEKLRLRRNGDITW